MADQDDKALDGLFTRLKAVRVPGEAAAIEQAIWAAWTHHGDPEINKCMSIAIKAMNKGALKLSLRKLDEAIAMDENFAEAWNKRATVFYMLEFYDASVRDIQKTLILEPRHFGALSGMGLIYTAIGKEKAALKVWEKALEIHPRLAGLKERVEKLRQKLKGEMT